jgi:hypothetical protein
MAIIVQDSFNRVDSTSSLGNAETGQAWSIVGEATAGITNNQAYFSSLSGTANYRFAVVDTGVQEYEVELKITDLVNISNVCFRVLSLTDFFMVRYNSSGAKYELYKRVANVFTLLGSYSGAAVNDVIKVSNYSNGQIDVYINGVLRITATDTDLITNTNCGFGNYSDFGSGKFDDFMVYSLDSGGSTAFDVRNVLYSTSSFGADSRQAIYSTSVLNYDVKQAIYEASQMDGDIHLVIYADTSTDYDVSQSIYAEGASVFDTQQTIFDPDMSLIGTVQLQGNRQLNVYLVGKQALNVNLKGLIQ